MGPWRYTVFGFEMGLYMILAGLLSLFFYQQDRAPSGILNLNGIACILPSFMAQVHTEVKTEREVYEFHDSFIGQLRCFKDNRRVTDDDAREHRIQCHPLLVRRL